MKPPFCIWLCYTKHDIVQSFKNGRMEPPFCTWRYKTNDDSVQRFENDKKHETALLHMFAHGAAIQNTILYKDSKMRKKPPFLHTTTKIKKMKPHSYTVTAPYKTRYCYILCQVSKINNRMKLPFCAWCYTTNTQYCTQCSLDWNIIRTALLHMTLHYKKTRHCKMKNQRKRPFAHDRTRCDAIVPSFKNEKPNETALLHLTLYYKTRYCKMRNQMKSFFAHDAKRCDDIVPSFKMKKFVRSFKKNKWNALLHMTLMMTLHYVTIL